MRKMDLTYNCSLDRNTPLFINKHNIWQNSVCGYESNYFLLYKIWQNRVCGYESMTSIQKFHFVSDFFCITDNVPYDDICPECFHSALHKQGNVGCCQCQVSPILGYMSETMAIFCLAGLGRRVWEVDWILHLLWWIGKVGTLNITIRLPECTCTLCSIVVG